MLEMSQQALEMAKSINVLETPNFKTLISLRDAIEEAVIDKYNELMSHGI